MYEETLKKFEWHLLGICRILRSFKLAQNVNSDIFVQSQTLKSSKPDKISNYFALLLPFINLCLFTFIGTFYMEMPSSTAALILLVFYF